MYIIFEEHQYEADTVKDVLRGISELQDVDKMVSVSYVGYYYEPHIHACVFILPKVLLNEQDQLVIGEGVTLDPAKVITEFADEKNAGLIVMGARGLSAVEGFFLGSVSREVMELAHCAVLIVKQKKQEEVFSW